MKLFIYHWFIEDEEDEEQNESLKIRVYGINERQETVLLHLNNFQQWLYIEAKIQTYKGEYESLTQQQWNQFKSVIKQKMIDKLPKLLKKKFYGCSKKKLYFLHSHTFHYFRLCFHSMKARKQVYYAFSNYKFKYANVNLSLCCHEYEASPLLQLICSKNLSSTGWAEFKGSMVSNANKISLLEHEYNVHYEDIHCISNEISLGLGVPLPSVLSFDLEVYSHNWSKMPTASNDLDVIFQISCIF
jgi:hypothetical protein